MAEISGGGIIAKMLKAEGVENFFGIVDGTYTHLFVSCVDEGLKMITPRHESVAAHMAGAYARLSGKLGVAIASNGPGVANMLSGAAVEHLEGNRVLLITSSRRKGCSTPDRLGAYQQFDQHRVIREMSKWSVHIRDFERIPEQMREALRRSFSGKPGLVHVDIPEDVINSFGPEPKFLKPEQYRELEGAWASPSKVKAAAKLIAESKRFIIQAGSGVIHALAFAELAELAALSGAAVTNSWGGKGVMPDDSPNYCPMSIVDLVNHVRTAGDLCLCLGGSMGETDWWGKAPYWAKTTEQKFIQVDIEEENIGRNRQVDLAVVADIKVFLQQLIAELKAMGPEAAGLNKPERQEMLAVIAGGKKKATQEVGAAVAQMPSRPMHTLQAALTLRLMLPPDTVFVLDGGNTAVWGIAIASQKPNCQLSTWHMGHLGTGQGYALGAAIARPQSPVCLFIGDGAMGFHMQEIETAVRYGLKIIFVVVADKQWGMVKINQIAAVSKFKDRYTTALKDRNQVNGDFGEIEWDKVGQAMGAYGERIKEIDQLGMAIMKCAALPGPSVLHLDVDPQAHLMCPTLQSFKEMHNEPAGE